MSSVRTVNRLDSFRYKFNIDPTSSKVSIQIVNPSYDAWFRGVATAIFCKFTGFNLGFGCAQYDPAPAVDVALGYHNTINHQLQMCLSKWLRFYVGGHVLNKLGLSIKQWEDGASDDQKRGDFSDLKNDGRLIPSPESLLNFFGDVYAARMVEFLPSNVRPRLPEDIVHKSIEFFSPPMTSVWMQRTESLSEDEIVHATTTFVEKYMSFLAKGLVVFIQDPRHEKDLISLNMYNATSMYHGSIPFPPDVDKYSNRTMSLCKFVIGPYYVPNNVPKNENDAIHDYICVLRVKHTFKSGESHRGFYVMMPVLFDPENKYVLKMMNRRREYRNITETLIDGISKSNLIRVRMNYADLEVYDGPVKKQQRQGESQSVNKSMKNIMAPSSSSSSSSSSFAPSSSSSLSSSISDDDGDEESDSIEKKASMDSKVKDAFKLGFSRGTSSSSSSSSLSLSSVTKTPAITVQPIEKLFTPSIPAVSAVPAIPAVSAVTNPLDAFLAGNESGKGQSVQGGSVRTQSTRAESVRTGTRAESVRTSISSNEKKQNISGMSLRQILESSRHPYSDSESGGDDDDDDDDDSDSDF